MTKSDLTNGCNVCKKPKTEADLEDPEIINWNLVNLLESDDCELLGSGDLVEETV